MAVCLNSADRVNGDDDLWGEELTLKGSDDGIEDERSELDREWNRRQNQFHTIGYRDGLMAGKEASLQEGFNFGFREAVMAGYNWGLARGITSALAFLPDGLKDKLIGSPEKRSEFEQLYESIHSVSSTEALKLFHSDLINKKFPDPSVDSSTSVRQMKVDSVDDSSDVSPKMNASVKASYGSKLETFRENLRVALCESSAQEMISTLG